MFEFDQRSMNRKKILIFGNSGSGKTYLANIISQKHGIKMLSLDDVYWRDKKYTKAKSHKWSASQVREFSRQNCWVIEGVYSHLLQLVALRANTIIWLDLAYESCIKNVKKRDNPCNPYMLLRMKQYYTRTRGSSWLSHHELFCSFNGRKSCLLYTSDAADE